MKGTLWERFVSKTVRDDASGCLIWVASRTLNGYGKIFVDGRLVLSHRVAFFLRHGRWPEHLCCHHCDNPSCVEWSHLFEGTHSDNFRDMYAKGRRKSEQAARAHCPKGHPYAGANLIVTYERVGPHRTCRECNRIASRERWRRKNPDAPRRGPYTAKASPIEG